MIAGEKLYIDEVMCLQMAGMSTPEIMRVNFMAFNHFNPKIIGISNRKS